MREIVLDTETTGMDPSTGDRIIEIGALELINHLPTGKTYHVYINPERSVPPEATAVHGLTDAFLKDKPSFGEIIGDFVDFIRGGTLVIHNAEFDVKFLNHELKTFGFATIDLRTVTDTVKMARQKFPGAPANLDALCRRFGIDNSGRVLHGALLDAQLLAEVYLELLGGRQRGLDIHPNAITAHGATTEKTTQGAKPMRPARAFPTSDAEKAAHQAMLNDLKNPLWNKG